MAIILKCSKCQHQLEVDDGFAGGICRCVHCGALSQVPLQPTRLDNRGRPAAPPEMGRAVSVSAAQEQTLVIAPSRRYVENKKQRGLLAVILLVVAVVLSLVAALMIWRMVKSGQIERPGGRPPVTEQPQKPSGKPHTGGSRTGAGTGTTGRAGTGDQSPTVDHGPAVRVGSSEAANPFTQNRGPQIAGLAIPGAKVAFVVNTGDNMPALSDVLAAVRLSVASLGKGTFMVETWGRPASAFLGASTPAAPPQVFPARELAAADMAADRARLKEFTDKLAGEETKGMRDPAPAVEAAIQRGAETIVVVTAVDLPATALKAIRAKVGDKKVTFLVAVVSSAVVDDFANLASLAGGAKGVVLMSEDDLARWAKDSP